MVGPPWIAVLGSGPRVDADNRSHTNPLTGKPDAGDPPVRFGGRGSGKPLSLPLSRSCLAGGQFRTQPAKIIVFSASNRYTARVARMNIIGKTANASAVNREYLAPAWSG